jgi:hypothetical protein
VIVITEFMAEDAIHGILGSHHMRYDAELVDRRDDLLAAVATADALIVRNRTRVNAALGMSVCAFDPLIAAGDEIWASPGARSNLAICGRCSATATSFRCTCR